MLVVPLALGEHSITLRVTDAFDNESTDTALIAVVDTVPPAVDCSTARVTGVDLRRVVIQALDACTGPGEIEVDAVLRSHDNTCAPLTVAEGDLFLLECTADRCHSDASGALPKISAIRPQLVVEGHDGTQGTTCIVDLCDRSLMRRRSGVEPAGRGDDTMEFAPDTALADESADTHTATEATPEPEPRERTKSKAKKGDKRRKETAGRH
jgi:hypothetical protein